ncbi:molybdopterin-binding protein [Sinomonas halotolerans]|uniref:Molybdopterin molybdenumtransferase n=1 Tax=Sinomonas halotolerans TaxID=1644133 RepID=A0ABU9WX24_9MICC
MTGDDRHGDHRHGHGRPGEDRHAAGPGAAEHGTGAGHGSASGHRSVPEHRARLSALLAHLAAREPVTVSLEEAQGAALAEDLVAPGSLPRFDNSQMDGFAVSSADFDRPPSTPSGASTPSAASTAFTVAAAIAAGDTPEALAPGHAAPIMTGAMLPEGADAVVPVEQAHPRAYPGPGERVELPAAEPGTFVRRAGSDVEGGAVVLRAGTVLGPRQLGLAAGLGIGRVRVRPRLSVAVVSTGAELAEPGDGLAPGQIHDANTALLAAALREAGITARTVAVRTDDPAVLLGELGSLTAGSGRPDAVITTGGVSQGAFEATKLALGGRDVEFAHLAMQPGGPQGLGTFNGTPLIAFPGNPVSCWISWEILLRPVLSALLGAPAPRRRLRVPLAEPLSSPQGRLQVRRARLLPDGRAELVGGPGSHLLGALAASDALVLVPEDVTHLPAGADVEVWLT